MDNVFNGVMTRVPIVTISHEVPSGVYNGDGGAFEFCDEGAQNRGKAGHPRADL